MGFDNRLAKWPNPCRSRCLWSWRCYPKDR